MAELKNPHLRRGKGVRSEIRRAAAGRLDRLHALDPDPRALELPPAPESDPRQLSMTFLELEVEGDDATVAAGLQLASALIGGRRG